MKAIEIASLDGPHSMHLVDREEPTGKVIIDVHAAGVAFPEVLLARGLYQLTPQLPFVPGSECSGVVRSAPAESGLVVGQRVIAFPGLGAYAETVAVHPLMVFSMPENLSFIQAAAIPLNYFTMHFALERRGHLISGERVLVHGAAGGIGTAAIQIAKFRGAHVTAVVSSDAKAEVARTAGADEVLLTSEFAEFAKSGQKVDLIVDPVGGELFTDSLRALRPEGRLLVIGFTGGEIPNVKVNRLLLNNISVVGVGWGAFWMDRDPAFLQEQWRELEPGVRAGAICPIIGRTYPLAEAGHAIADMESRRAVGRIVLEVR